jgi:hypothetical protein
VCLPVAVGLALLVLGWAPGRLQRFVFWLALALVGQAVALQMIEAGPTIRYQHYRPFVRLLDNTKPLLLGFLMLQTVLVLAGLRTRWTLIRAWLGRNFRGWQLMGLGLVFALSSAAPSRELSLYIGELVLATFVQAVNLGNVVLLAWALPDEILARTQRWVDALLGQPRARDGGDLSTIDGFAVVAALWVTILAAVLAVLSYQRHPHVPDEVIYLYHARYLAAGRLSVPAPPVPEAFSFYLIPYRADQWYSIFSPGWPAMLAVGVLAGVPWLVNPVLAGINVLLVYVLLQGLYELRTARVAVLLLCASPWFLFMGMNFMAHTFMLTCALLAAVGTLWARRTGKARWALLSGGAIGCASLIRPLDGLIVAVLIGLWALGVGGRRLRVPSIAAFISGVLVVGGLVLPYNWAVTGTPTAFPLTAYYAEYFGPKVFALGFGPDRGFDWPLDPFPGHSVLDALVNAHLNTFSLNSELFGWSTGSLLLIALLLFVGAVQKSDLLMLAVLAATGGVYSLFWFSGGPDFGARYWYLMLIPLVALTARAVRHMTGMCRDELSGSKEVRVLVTVLILCVFSAVNYLPWRATDKYHHFRGMRPGIASLAEEYGFGRSLVLIRGNVDDYQSAWAYNPLDFRASVPVYAWDQNAGIRAQLLKAFPDRPVWFVDGPSLTQRGYNVTAMRLPAAGGR